MTVDALAEKIGLLLSQGNLASSRLTARDRTRLQSLFETGVLTVERSGAGKNGGRHKPGSTCCVCAALLSFRPARERGRTCTEEQGRRRIAGFEEGPRNRTAHGVAARFMPVQRCCRSRAGPNWQVSLPCVSMADRGGFPGAWPWWKIWRSSGISKSLPQAPSWPSMRKDGWQAGSSGLAFLSGHGADPDHPLRGL
jgi:hypothetical protein